MKKPMKKPVKKFKRFQDGGDVAADKQRGLDISNKEEPVGFFERIRMGNIDEPGTEAYNRFGAGRGRDRGESVSVNKPMPAAPTAPAMPAASLRPLSDDMYSDYGPSAGRSSSETVTSSRPVATKPTVTNKPPAPSLRTDLGESVSVNRPISNFSNEGRTKPVGAAASQIPGQSAKAPQGGEKIDSSETERNINAALTVAGLGSAAGAYRLKKMYDASKAAKQALLKNPRLERPGTVAGKDFVVQDYKGAAQTASKGVPKKQLGYKKDTDVTDVIAKKRGGKIKKYASGGMVSSASKRADGIAMKGKTRGKIY